MKHLPILLASALTACEVENGLTAQSPTYEQETCVDELADGVISYKNVDPSAFPLNVSSIDEVGLFRELFEGFRDGIFAVTAVPNLDGETSTFFDSEISSAIDEVEFADSVIQFENGDFQVTTNFGEEPSLSQVMADVIITDADCQTLYGYAGYSLDQNDAEFSSSLEYYMDENGDLLYF